MAHYLIQSIFLLTGAIATLASLFNWDWFFTAQNTRFIVKNVGRLQARWFYGLLGCLLIGMAVFFFLNTPSPNEL